LTALVLSAGGLFGAYQAGAWKHLRHVLKPDLVVGASVGALNGWQIASDPSADIEQSWLSPETSSIIELKPNGNLLRGYFNPDPLLRAAKTIYEATKPIIPFSLVVVEVPRFRSRVIPAAEVKPEHLAATCSIYLFYPNVRINGRQYTDGGMFGHLPLWAAALQGATKIIGIDCMPKMEPWWVQTTISTLHKFGPRIPLPQHVHILKPSEAMGHAQSAMMYDAKNIRRWIDLGEQDAKREFPQAASGLKTGYNK
jgi:predicted acylesterase/phospholipase RssA